MGLGRLWVWDRLSFNLTCRCVKLAYTSVTLKHKTLFRGEMEKKSLGASLVQGLMVTGQVQLGLRDDFLGIHAHLGFGKGWFSISLML